MYEGVMIFKPPSLKDIWSNIDSHVPFFKQGFMEKDETNNIAVSHQTDNGSLPTTDFDLSIGTQPLSTKPATGTASKIHKPDSQKSRPSCNLCRKSKIKCDRKTPCAHCEKIGAECIYPPPSKLPRGRKGGRKNRNTELLNRIANLEKLVEEIGDGYYDDKQATLASDPGNEDGLTKTLPRSVVQQRLLQSQRKTSTGADRYIGSTVWLSLSEEITSMKDILDQPSDDDGVGNDSTSQSTSTPLGSHLSPNSGSLLFPAQTTFRSDTAMTLPTQSQIQYLIFTFFENVDACVKILHMPSMRRYFLEGAERLECSPGPAGIEALSFAIFFVATTSLTEEQCLNHLGATKANLVARFRYSTEHALSINDLLVTQDMSSLQALVLYMFAIRSNGDSRRLWTLTSLAIRIAQALGLNREKFGEKSIWSVTVFEREMRRRLWWQICLIDRHTSMDRASDPLISVDGFSTEMPVNVDDEDLVPDMKDDIPSRKGFTDATMAMVGHELFRIERRLNHVPAAVDSSSQIAREQAFFANRQFIVDCQRRLEDNYLQYCKMTVPIQRFTRYVGDIMITSAWLWMYRPLHRRPNSPPCPEAPYPGVLQLAVEVVEKALQVPPDPLLKQFKWMWKIWVQWHALAVMLAELCVQTAGPTVERAWIIASAAYEESAKYVADSDKGQLWRPVKRLMDKARAMRLQYLNGVISAPSKDNNVNERMQNTTNQRAPADFTTVNNVPQLPSATSMGDFMQFCTDQYNQSHDQEKMQTDFPDDSSNFNDWNRWALSDIKKPAGQANDFEQLAWNDWGSFVDDLYGSGNFLPTDGVL